MVTPVIMSGGLQAVGAIRHWLGHPPTVSGFSTQSPGTAPHEGHAMEPAAQETGRLPNSLLTTKLSSTQYQQGNHT